MGWLGSGRWGLGGWIGTCLVMVVLWGLVVLAVVALFRRTGGRRQRPGRDVAPDPSPAPGSTSTAVMATLDERFARGDLTEEEYRRTREILQRR